MATTTQAPVAEEQGSPAPPRADLVSTLARSVLPWLMVLVVLAAMVRWAARPLTNPDTYFHLRFGQEFLDGDWSLRHPGHVTSWATADWVPTQWLSQVAMAKTYDWFGLAGVAWLSGLLFVSLTLALLLGARRFASMPVAAPLVVVGLLAHSVALSMRPQVLSYIASVVVVVAWMRVRERPDRVPWRLVPMFWLWAMCHGMWPLGLIISFVAIVGLVLDGTIRRRRVVTFLSVPVLGTVAAALLTPVGPGLLPGVLLVNSRGKYFEEWGPPHFTAPNCLAALALLAVTVLVMTRLQTSWFDTILVGLAAGFLVYSARTVPIAADMLVPLGAFQLQRLLARRTPLRRRETTAVLGAAAAALAVLAAAVPSVSTTSIEQPAWVDGALSALPPGTRVYNGMFLGGYLMWRYPAVDFMSSGYGDIYTTGELDELGTIGQVRPGWERTLREADPAYAFVDPSTPVAYALVHQEGWEVLHHSKQAELLQPPPGWSAEPDSG